MQKCWYSTQPTSSLTFREVDSLFTIIRALASHQIGIFFISHRLNEILAIADRISVLRDGNLVLSQACASLTSRDLIRAMLPEASSQEGAETASNEDYMPVQPGDVVLEVKDLQGEAFHGINLKVRAGEVVGVAGVVGAGRTELAQAILGIEANTHGEVWICGKRAEGRTPNSCQELGLVYVPEDRHEHGIFLELPSYMTTTGSILPKLGKILMSFTKERTLADQYVKQLRIKLNSREQLSRTLSGGNQQKVVLSKCLASEPRVIIFDEPTRGVDAKARQDVYHLIHSLALQGVGVLMISSDLEEVTQLSDRVLVMYRGTILEELARSESQIERITAAAFGMRGGICV